MSIAVGVREVLGEDTAIADADRLACAQAAVGEEPALEDADEGCTG